MILVFFQIYSQNFFTKRHELSSTEFEVYLADTTHLEAMKAAEFEGHINFSKRWKQNRHYSRNRRSSLWKVLEAVAYIYPLAGDSL